MSLSDEQFREEYKPLHIPAHYKDAVTEQDKVIFALAQLGSATADEVNNELEKYKAGTDATSILKKLFDTGHIKGIEVRGGIKQYDLSKITHANDGAVDRDIPEPGLD